MNLNRRAFLAGLAAIAAPLFARLALPAAPGRKLLGKRPPIPWKTGTKNEEQFFEGHLQVWNKSKARWEDLGEVVSVSFGAAPGYRLANLSAIAAIPIRGRLLRSCSVIFITDPQPVHNPSPASNP